MTFIVVCEIGSENNNNLIYETVVATKGAVTDPCNISEGAIF